MFRFVSRVYYNNVLFRQRRYNYNSRVSIFISAVVILEKYRIIVFVLFKVSNEHAQFKRAHNIRPFVDSNGRRDNNNARRFKRVTRGCGEFGFANKRNIKYKPFRLIYKVV